MAAKKCKNIFWEKCFAFLNVYCLKALNSLDFSRPNRILPQKPKTGGFKELFLPENNFKTCFAVNFSKKTSRFWRPENQPKT